RASRGSARLSASLLRAAPPPAPPPLPLHDALPIYGAPTEDRPVEFTYEDLLGMRSETLTAFIECTGNGRGFFASQQGQQVKKPRDRKSTRLNSSHVKISYAVFCLKKKTRSAPPRR